MKRIVKQKPNSINSVAITGRVRTSELINKYYFKFGNRVVQTMRRFASRPNGVSEIVDALHLEPVDRTQIHMHDAVFKFVTNFGTVKFLEVADKLERGETPEAPVPDFGRASAFRRNGNATKENQDGSLVVEDRRSGKNRRVDTDRRGQVDAVNSNRRYGGERRKIWDRRQEQIPGPWPRTPQKKP